jgi:hypothetical protein
LAVILATSAPFSQRASADELLFTETNPSNIVLTLAGVPSDNQVAHGVLSLDTQRLENGQLITIPYTWVFRSFGYILPDTTFSQTWERLDGSGFVNLMVYREPSFDRLDFVLSLADSMPGLVAFSTSNPVASDGDVVSLSSPIWLYDSLPITEIGFIDLSDVKPVPDASPSWLLVLVPTVALLMFKAWRS